MPTVVPLITNFMEHKKLHTRTQHGPNPEPNKSSQHLIIYLLKINTDILFHPCAIYFFNPELPTKPFHTFCIFPTNAATRSLTIFQYLTTLIIFTE